MSTLRVTNLKGGSAGSAPNLPDGAVVTGVITATSFSGSGANLTGIDATALKDGSGNVKIQANSDGAVVTGILTATGNVSIGGTLTYEDVTNVDSVGLITARSGVVDSTLTSGRILIAGASGRLTDNNNLKFDGNQLDIDSSAQNNLKINSTHSDGPNIFLERNGSAFAYLGSAAANISGGTATDLAIRAQGSLLLTSNGGNERLRIGPAGQIGVAGANYGTDGQVLTSKGGSAAVQWADAGGGAFEVVSSTVLSGSTSDVQLYGWSNNYAQYKVVFQDCYHVSDVKMRIRFYTDATSGNNGTLNTGSSYAYVGARTRFSSGAGPTVEYQGSDDYFYPFTNRDGGELHTGELTFPMKTSGYSDAVKCYGNMMSHTDNWTGIACELNANQTHFLTGIHIYFVDTTGSPAARAPSTGRITLLRMKYS